MLVTLPCVLLLLDFWPLRRTTLLHEEPVARDHYRNDSGRSLLEKVPFFLLAIGLSVVTMFAQSSHGAMATIEQARRSHAASATRSSPTPATSANSSGRAISRRSIRCSSPGR